MHYAEIKTCDIANGPGVRTSLFVSGCTHRCKGCFNEIAWDFNYGRDFTDDTIKEIIDSLAPDYVTGLTLLGGEWKETKEMLQYIDVIVDGKYEEDKKDMMLQFKGSSNQRTILVKESLESGNIVLLYD